MNPKKHARMTAMMNPKTKPNVVANFLKCEKLLLDDDLSSLKKELKRDKHVLRCRDIHGRSLIMIALKYKKYECAELCIKNFFLHKSVLMYRDQHSDGKQYTALHIAAEQGQFKLAALLVQKGAAIKSYNEMGDTPASLAKNNKYHKLGKFLVEGWKTFKHWDPSIHVCTPRNFQNNVFQLLKVLHRIPNMCRDIKFLIIDHLFKLYVL